MSTFAIVPLKRFADAKRRLSPVLDDAARSALAEAMAADVLAALAQTRHVDRTLVVSRDPRALRLARTYGAIPIADASDRSLRAAARAGIRAALARGATRALIVSGDCPALDPAELDALLAAPPPPAPAVVVVPDRHGAGTNALLLSPPGAISPAFGEGSCARHLVAAQAAGVPARVAPLASLALDVDTPADLDRLSPLLEHNRPRAAQTRRALAALTTAPVPR